jgi:hypothetical protein
MKEPASVPQFKKALKECLQSAPFVRRVEFKKREFVRNAQTDFVGRVLLPDGMKVILAECKNNGQPRFARQATNQLSLWVQKFPGS